MKTIETKPITERTILMLAADIMNERGRCTGIHEDTQGRVCLEGAVLVAVRELYAGRPLMEYEAMQNRALTFLGVYSRRATGRAAIHVNDYIHKHKDEGVRFLRAAATE